MVRLFLILIACILPLSAVAQDAAGADATARDRSFLTGLIEDNLSGAGRSVRLDGFAGALSSRATFDRLTIADDEGVWITVRNGAISWNRSALLSGRIEIDEMSAEEIDLPRGPATSGTPSEASGFSLPEFPVGISIGTLRADRVVLGEPVMGVPAEVSLQGSMNLANGEGSADLRIQRVDGKTGELTLTGSYANATREATLDLLVKEAADGIAVELLGIPGRPSAEIAIHGTGPIDIFRTDVSVRTDGQPRLTGQIAFDTAAAGGGAVTRSFSARLAGDLTPLFLPEYRDFLGNDVSLEAEGRRLPSGQMDLTRLVLQSRGVDLSGKLSLNPAGMPQEAALKLRVGLPDGSAVLLPIPGDKTLVRSAALNLRYDQRAGDGWSLDGTVSDLRTPSVAVAALTIDGFGRIQPGTISGGATSAASIGGTVSFGARGIEPADPALKQAIGPSASGKTIFSWQPGAKLRFPVLQVTGQGYEAAGALSVDGLDSGLEVSGNLDAGVADLGRFSGLAGRPLGGSGDVSVRGVFGVLSGIVDGTLDVRGRDLSVAQPELDSLMKGGVRLSASVRRDEGGTSIRSLSLTTASLKASAAGLIASDRSDVRAELDFGNLSALGKSYRGALVASATLSGPAEGRRLALDATGDGLGVGQPQVDRIIGGKSDLAVAVRQRQDRFELQSFALRTAEVSVDATGSSTDAGQLIDLTARLRDMSLLAPGFPGPLTLGGTIAQEATGYRLDLKASGPGGTDATIRGTAAADLASVDLAIAGGAQAALLNPFIAPRNISGPVAFDLRMNGKPGLAALSGTATLRDGVVVAPNFGIEIRNVGVSVDLAGQRATVSASGNVRGGGDIRVSGPVTLSPPFDGDLAVMLRSAHLRDPELYDTEVSGTVTISGPLAGGARIGGTINLGRTELRIPSTGLGSQALLDNVTHVGEPVGVRRTRIRAGLVDTKGGADASGPAYDLDLGIVAPDRIFVRGRGLDAELGGALTLRGTTQNVIPSGQFSLVRGRLDILGKRFDIDEGLIELQGALTPYVRFSATTESGGIAATILIEGDATAPEIHFLSNPELPEEEVISRLLFSRSLSNLSALQAAQLASAVATLAGKGGEGIVGKLRKSFGLDDLDLATDENGATTVKLGKYISEKVYTDVAVGSDGKSEVSINLDLRKDLTVRGTAASDGTSGVGIYYERDY